MPACSGLAESGAVSGGVQHLVNKNRCTADESNCNRSQGKEDDGLLQLFPVVWFLGREGQSNLRAASSTL
jgi:hypothetical protein